MVHAARDKHGKREERRGCGIFDVVRRAGAVGVWLQGGIARRATSIQHRGSTVLRHAAGSTDGAGAGIKVDDVVPDTVLHTDSSTTPKRGEQGCAQHKHDNTQSAAHIIE
jgi:glutamate synthase domain-containing protein 1